MLKRIMVVSNVSKEIIGEDGTTRIEIWTLSVDHMSESAKTQVSIQQIM